MTAAALKNPGSCRQCGGAGIVVAADGANFDPCAVCLPASSAAGLGACGKAMRVLTWVIVRGRVWRVAAARLLPFLVYESQLRQRKFGER